MAGGAAGNQGQAVLPNGNAAAFRNRSTTGSAAGGQPFSSAGQCDVLLASSMSNRGQYSAAGALSAGVR
jgi:hypothetical protein